MQLQRVALGERTQVKPSLPLFLELSAQIRRQCGRINRCHPRQGVVALGADLVGKARSSSSVIP
jgi:hypothetical protein